MGVFGGSSQASIGLENYLTGASCRGVVYPLRADARVPQPTGLPPGALWAYGSETRFVYGAEPYNRETYRPLAIGSSYAVEVKPGRMANWDRPISLEVNGGKAGMAGYSPVRDVLGELNSAGYRVFVPGLIEGKKGDREIRLYMPCDTDLSAWALANTPQAKFGFYPPPFSASVGKYGIDRDAAKGLLGTSEHKTVPCQVSLEEVTKGKTAGQMRVRLASGQNVLGLVSPSQRDQLAPLFDLAEAGASGALSLSVSGETVKNRLALYPAL